MTNELNKTLEEATRAREKVIQETNKAESWVVRHPLASLAIGVVLVVAVIWLAVKAYA